MKNEIHNLLLSFLSFSLLQNEYDYHKKKKKKKNILTKITQNSLQKNNFDVQASFKPKNIENESEI